MRFVIHHHLTDSEHYDLMIEKGDVLHTWQVPGRMFKNFLEGKQVKVKKIQDHRKEYLTYEGPISCDRGMVEIYDTGKYIEEKWDDDIIIKTDGNKLKGKLSIINHVLKYSQKCL